MKIISCVALDAFQFEPDAEIIFQKDRLDLYEAVLQQLQQHNLVYACQCTRKMLGSNHIYAGTCRNLGLDFANQAIRVKVTDQEHLLSRPPARSNNAPTLRRTWAILS